MSGTPVKPSDRKMWAWAVCGLLTLLFAGVLGIVLVVNFATGARESKAIEWISVLAAVVALTFLGRAIFLSRRRGRPARR